MMSNYDDLFKQGNEQSASSNDQPFDKEAWKQQKHEQREMVYSMIDDTAVAVANDKGVFQKYLDVQGHFGRYSVANALLILAQKPDATRIADFDTWKEQGVYIRKKEIGFYILEPGEEYQRDDGSVGISYNPKKMFDISQTGANKIETPAYPDERTRIKALMDHAPVPIHICDTLPAGINALYNPDVREIQIRRGMDSGDIFRALSQELANAEIDTGDGSYSHSKYGFHAYCASYILCNQYGIGTSDYNFDHAYEMLKGKDAQEIRTELSIIRDATAEISSRMNRMLAQQQQQRRPDQER